MLLAFNASMAMLISVMAALFAGIVVIFNNGNLAVPIPVGIALIVLSGIGFSILLMSVPKLYSETLKRCSDDINGFAKEQKSIAKRCFGKRRLNVLLNLAFGLIAHERLDEAETILMQIAPHADKTGHSYKIKYLLFSLIASGKKKDYAGCSYILERLINELNTNNGLFILEKDDYEHLAEIVQLETAFYSLFPDNPNSNKKEITNKLNFLARKYLSAEHFTNELWNEYFTTHFNYILGTTYAVSGDIRSAEFYFGTIAKQPFTYPENARARYFLQTKNMDIFFRQQ